MIWRKPELLIFRDLLSTKEAERIKEIATPMVRYIRSIATSFFLYNIIPVYRRIEM